jgi:hypothetical protein
MEEEQMVLQAQFGGGLAELATNAINYGLSVMGKARVLTVLNLVWAANTSVKGRSEERPLAKTSHSKPQRLQPMVKNHQRANLLQTKGHRQRNLELRMAPRRQQSAVARVANFGDHKPRDL